MDDEARIHSWNAWLQYVAEWRQAPYLPDMSKHDQQEILLAFGARVRTGFFGKKRQVGAQSVEKAMRHVAQTLVLAGFTDPRRTSGARELDLPFSRMTKTMRDSDPAPRPQLALPVVCITAAAAVRFHNGATRKQQAVADLITVAFFFLLRVGEYTMPIGNRRTRTVQFRCQDVRLWRFGQLLDHTAPLEHLLQADGVTLHIDNQKNGQRGQTVHHSAVNAWFCPAKACARRVHEIRSAGLPPDTPLSFLGNNTHVVAADILNAVRMAARQTNLPANGYDLTRIGAHSLRASGAMALKLNGYDKETIMKIGRWSSDTFMTYIHSQIAALTIGVAAKMTRQVHFQNVGS